MTTQNAGEKEQGMSEVYTIKWDGMAFAMMLGGEEVDKHFDSLHADVACEAANLAHAHATDAAARRVRELEDREGILLEALEACRVNDRSVAYEYGEKRKLDEAAPPKGKRWNTPFEISRDAIGEWAKVVFGTVGVQSLRQALAGKERSDGGE